MLSPFPYIFACLSLSLLFRQSLLYDSQFNISIRTRLISTARWMRKMKQPQTRICVPYYPMGYACSQIEPRGKVDQTSTHLSFSLLVLRTPQNEATEHSTALTLAKKLFLCGTQVIGLRQVIDLWQVLHP